MKNTFRTALLSSLVFFQTSAHAAQTAVVDVDVAPIMDKPKHGAGMVDKARRGTTIILSNHPTEGFYKVRMPNGTIGWIPVDAIRLDVPVSSTSAAPNALPSGVVPHELDAYKPVHLIPELPWAESLFEIRAFGGLSYINPDDYNQYFSKTMFNSALGFGAELGVRIAPRLYAVARLERMTKTVSTTDMNPNNTGSYSLELNSTPFCIGLEYAISREKKFSLDMAVLIGVGFSTEIKATALGKPQPNVTEYESSPFTSIAKLNGNYRITRKFGVFSDFGYRFLRTAPIVPGKVGSGSVIFQAGGVYPPTVIDLSGFFLGAGIVFFL